MQSSNGARRIDIAQWILPGALECLIAVLLPELFSVLKAIGYKRHDLVKGDPLILLSDPFGLGRLSAVIADRESVELAKALGCPSQFEYSSEDVSLDLTKIDLRRTSSLVAPILPLSDPRQPLVLLCRKGGLQQLLCPLRLRIEFGKLGRRTSSELRPHFLDV